MDIGLLTRIIRNKYKAQIGNRQHKKLLVLNTIAALTYHINYYLAGLLNAFENGNLEIRDKYSFNFPEINSEVGWRELIADFLNNSEKFAFRVEQMDDRIFEQTFVDERYGNYLRNIEGVIEHSYYHLGQISLIRKMIMQNKTEVFQEIQQKN